MPLSGLVIVPAAPMLLPAASPAQPAQVIEPLARLRREVATALSRLPTAATALLLVAGDEYTVLDAPRASLASYGLPQVARDVAIDTRLIGAVSARGQAPRIRSANLEGDAAVLSLLVGAHAPHRPLAPLTVPRRVGRTGLTGVAAGLAAALDDVAQEVVVVAAGDLAATLDESSPGYLVPDASAWDATALAAVRDVDTRGFVALGPEEAERVQARGWAPVAAALILADHNGVGFDDVSYHVPKGVGQLVAR